MTTTTGSIDGKLRFDISEFLEKVAIVKREARSLGDTHPTIDVDANTGRAQASMAAVSAVAQAMGQSAASAGDRVKRSANDIALAEAKVAAANQAADVAYEKARVAQLRLSEAQTAGRTKASTLAAAELAVSEALGRLENANLKATAAEEALKHAQEETANAALKQAAAQEVAATATNKAGNAAANASARTQLIIAAVLGLTVLAGPLTAALVGVGGALAGLGGAGVLGIIGAAQAIKQGTQAGQEWSAGLKSLKGDLAQLSGTAAAGMLGTFQRAVALINQSMPELNNEVAGFTRILGSAGMSALQGVITAFRILNPLFMQGAGVIQDIAAGFASWTANGGLQAFASYAQAQLPQVIGTIGHLAEAILHIAEATAPIGTVVLAVLDGLANVINALPIEVLTSLAAGALAGFAAFKTWDVIVPMLAKATGAVQFFGTEVSALQGKAGIVGIALAALAAIISGVAEILGHAKTQQEGYTYALEQDTDAIGKNVRVTALKQLTDAGALYTAKQMGITTRDLIDATLGQGAGYERVTATIKEYSNGTKVQQIEAKRLSNLLYEQRDALSSAQKAQKDQAAATSDATSMTAAETEAVKRNAAAAGVSVDAYLSVQNSQGSMADQVQRATAQMYIQGDAAGLLKQSLDLLNGKTLSAEKAQNQFDSQIANMSDHIDAAGKSINRANAELEGNTAAAVKNRGELIDLTTAAENSAQAFRDNGGSAVDTKQKLIDMKQSIIDNAIAHGEDADQVHRFVDEIFKIPEKIPPTKAEVDTSAAEAALASLTRTRTLYIQAVLDRSALPDLNGTVSGNGRMGTLAYGGTIPGAAYGVSGTVRGNGSAWSDTAGLYRLANGEEVISNTVGQAGRYRPLLKAINQNASPAQIAARVQRIDGPQPVRTNDSPSVAVDAGGKGDTHVTQNFHVTMQPGTSAAQFAGELGWRAKHTM